MEQLLICDGKMDRRSALTRGDDGQLVLKEKPWLNEEAILQLLRTHAAVTAKTKGWPSALFVARLMLVDTSPLPLSA